MPHGGLNSNWKLIGIGFRVLLGIFGLLVNLSNHQNKNMQSDSIIHGETYDIAVQIQDDDGAPVVIDNTWQAACRITRQAIGGPVTAEPVMTIAAGAASCTLDTGAAEWAATTYYYDIRITDPDGNDYWTEPVRLTIQKRNTPAS